MFEIDDMTLLFNGKAIYEAIDEIFEIIVSDEDKAVIRYRSLGYAAKKGYMDDIKEFWKDITNEDDFTIINRNILCIDKEGKEVWRIEAPHLRDLRADSFISVIFEEDNNKWQGRTHFGHLCHIDMRTGAISDIRHYAVK